VGEGGGVSSPWLTHEDWAKFVIKFICFCVQREHEPGGRGSNHWQCGCAVPRQAGLHGGGHQEGLQFIFVANLNFEKSPQPRLFMSYRPHLSITKAALFRDHTRRNFSNSAALLLKENVHLHQYMQLNCLHYSFTF
jgi:hypothetical protein